VGLAACLRQKGESEMTTNKVFVGKIGTVNGVGDILDEESSNIANQLVVNYVSNNGPILCGTKFIVEDSNGVFWKYSFGHWRWLWGSR
jgi:hypothetical protein